MKFVKMNRLTVGSTGIANRLKQYILLVQLLFMCCIGKELLAQEKLSSTTIVVDVCVDASGEVIAVNLNDSTDRKDRFDLYFMAVRNAINWKFDERAEVERECGTISYKINFMDKENKGAEASSFLYLFGKGLSTDVYSVKIILEEFEEGIASEGSGNIRIYEFENKLSFGTYNQMTFLEDIQIDLNTNQLVDKSNGRNYILTSSSYDVKGTYEVIYEGQGRFGIDDLDVAKVDDDNTHQIKIGENMLKKEKYIILSGKERDNNFVLTLLFSEKM